MALHGGTFEDTGLRPALQLQDRDDLFHRTGRDFPPQLFGLFNELVKVFRQAAPVAGTSAFGFQAFKAAFPEGFFIPRDRFVRQAVLFCSLPAQLDMLRGVKFLIQQRASSCQFRTRFLFVFMVITSFEAIIQKRG